MSYNVTDHGAFDIEVYVNNTIANGAPQSIAFPNHPESIVNVFLILNNYTWGPSNHLLNTSIGDPYAAECILEFCIQNYTATEYNGTFVESASGSAITFRHQETTNQNGVNYSIITPSINSISYFLSTVMQDQENEVMVDDGQAEWAGAVGQSMYLHLNETPHTLDAMFNNIARSMTLAIRTRTDSTTLVNGTSYTQQTFVSVQWAWISLPFALLALSLLFLIDVALSTRIAGLQPWKGSSIATLFHGLRHLNDDEVHCLIQQHEMDEAAAGIQAILRMVLDG
jgi:hypothetical protein